MKVVFFKTVCFGLITFIGIQSFGLEGIQPVLENIEKNNLGLQSLVKQIEAAQTQKYITSSGYLPSLSVVGGWQKNTVDDLNQSEKGYNGYLQGQWNLFKGFKDQSLKQQKNIQIQILENELSAKKRELKLEVVEILSDMIMLHKMQEIIKQELIENQKQTKMAQKKVQAGLTSEIDYLEFELREKEIQIEQKQVDQKHDENHQKYLKIAGAELDEAVLKNIPLNSVQEASLSLNKPLDLNSNLIYKNSHLQLEEIESEKSEIKSEFLPSLDLIYSFGRLTPTEDSTFKLNESKYGLQLTIPLFTGLDTYYKFKSVGIKSQGLEKNRNQLIQNINADYKILITQLQQVIDLLKMNQKKLSLSEKYYNLTMSEYKRGVKNSPDLMSATERFFSTKKKNIELVKNLEVLKEKIDQY